MAVDLSGKRLSLLKEAVPSLSRVSFLADPRDPVSQRVVSAYANAAKAMSLSLQSFDVVAPDIEHAFATIARDGLNGVIVGPGSMMFNERARIGSSALALGDVCCWGRSGKHLFAASISPFNRLGRRHIAFSAFVRARL